MHFLDSGAFSLRRDVSTFMQQHSDSSMLDFYNSPKFKDYIDSYARCIKLYKKAIDLYANLDVIGHPELSWKHLQYLEDEHGLHPVPVLHAGVDFEWVDKHFERGYKRLAIGGLVRNSHKPYVGKWLDRFFSSICPQPTYLPTIKVHAFGMMSGPLLFKYPFWSADATNVGKLGWYGKIIVPRKDLTGRYDYSKPCFIVALSERVKSHSFNINYQHIKGFERNRHVIEWIEYINESGYYNRPLVIGPTTNEDYMAVNFFFYQMMRRAIGEWPFPYSQAGCNPDTRKTQLQNLQEFTFTNQTLLKLYLSGSHNGEAHLRQLGVPHIDRMLTFYDSYQKSDGIETELLKLYQARGGRHKPKSIKKRKQSRARKIGRVAVEKRKDVVTRATFGDMEK